MLPLPKGLVIDRDLEEEKKLLARTRAWLEAEERSPGFHLSGLLDPRKEYFSKKYPGPIPDRLINMFMVGKVAHGIIELIQKGEGSIASSDAGSRERDGIQYSPDAFHDNGSPVEIKTTRSFYLPKQAYLPDDDTYHRYLEQLLGYMALEGSTEGRLTILYLNSKGDDGRTEPHFFVWKITTIPEAVTAYKSLLVRTKNQIEQALEIGDHTSLPLCRAFMCEDCEYWDDCKPEGRYGVDKKEWLRPRKGDKTQSDPASPSRKASKPASKQGVLSR